MHPTNRTIWTLWYQGFDRAPPLVRTCLESWQNLNPGWRVVALDRDSIRDHVDLRRVIDLERPDLTVQKIAAVARLCLLRRFGGVWTDATVFCVEPLDRWLPDHYSTGFTVFRNPGQDRLASNWFIAAEADNALLVALADAFIGFMNRRVFTNQNNAFGRAALALLEPRLARSAARSTLWLNPLLQALVRAYPYFIFHYSLNALVLGDPALRRLLETERLLDARPAHALQAFACDGDGLPRALDALERGISPLQKLDWRYDIETPYWSAVMARLAERARPSPPALGAVAR